MQEHALQALFLKYLVPLEISVFIVPGNGVPLGGKVNSDLVRSSCLDGDLQQGAINQPLCDLHQGDGAHAIGILVGRDLHTTLAIWQKEFVQRAVNHL